MLLALFAIAIALLSTWGITFALESCLRAPRRRKFLATSKKQVSFFSLLLFLLAPFSLVRLPDLAELDSNVHNPHNQAEKE